jgi:hypothetical protein
MAAGDQQGQQSPSLPQGVTLLAMEQFAGMNTIAARVSVPDKQVYWYDGFMPLAPGRLRTLGDVGTPLFAIAGIIKAFTTSQAIWVWLNTGDLYRYDVPGATLSLVVAATFTSDPTLIGACLIPGTENVIFVQKPGPSAYYIYDAGNFYGPGAVTPDYGTVPVGISGSTVELYSGHVWVGDGNVIVVSAPGSYVDFATADGGVEFTSPDSFLQQQYTVLKSSGGFLYCFGDNSVSYISGVTTSGVIPTTTFTYQNADTTVGSSNWNDSVVSTGRDLLFANLTGVFQLRGGEAKKVSYELDGFYGTMDTTTLIPQMAQTVIFGRRVWILLATVTNLLTNAVENRLLMWDGGNWFTSLQSVPLVFITTLETGSQFAVIGVDSGGAVYELFTTPSTLFMKTVQSKFWAAPESYYTIKAASRFWALTNYYNLGSPNLTVTIDHAIISSVATYTIVNPGITGYFATPAIQIGQTGPILGMTITTSCADMEINSAMIAVEVVQYRG